MEYADGKIMEAMIENKLVPLLENQDKIINALSWMAQAMKDNGLKPKEAKQDEPVKA